MKLKSFIAPLALSAGAVFLNLINVPAAKAYSVNYNGRTAGNPAQQRLVDVGIDSRHDITRQLDSTDFSLQAGSVSTLSNTLTGNAVMTVLNLQQNLLSLKIKINNDTDANFQASITSLWFGIQEKVSGTTLQGGDTFMNLRANGAGKAPGGFKKIDVCIFGGNTCNGGNINKGLRSGESDTVIVDIAGEFGVNDHNGNYLYSTATISDFGVKWQTSDGSYQVAGVPEPITVLGSGAALAFGIVMKRRRTQPSDSQGESIS